MKRKLLTFTGLFLFVFIVLAQVQAQNLDENGKLPRATAESQGVSSDVLTRLIDRLDAEVISPNSVMVLRHGKVIGECWWAPHSPETTHALYSLSKSFCSTAAGFAVSEGKLSLDDRIVDLFRDYLPADFENPEPADKYDLLKKSRLRHLLSMSCGQEKEPPLKGLFPVDFSRPEEGDCWQKEFFASPFTKEPGTFFRYNTAGTFMVSAAVQQAVGQTIRDYLVPRLFEPLRIETPYWEESPNGINKGGTGLFLKTEDIAKFGQFILQRGQWNGQQLLPAEWVDQATSFQVSNGNDPNSDWAQGYGFQFWRCRFNVFRGDGMYCQFMIAIPEKDVVVAMTNDSGEYQKVVNIVFEVLLPELQPNAQTKESVFSDTPLPENPAAVARLQNRAKQMKVRDGQSPSVVLEKLRCPSKILGYDVEFYAYLPQGYLVSGFKYPTLYLLHGGGGVDQGEAWSKKGDMKRISDEFFRNRAEKAIVIMPSCKDARWRNDFEGKVLYEDFFIKELIPYVESIFRCKPGPENRAIAGLSRGGYGSLFYSLRHPDVFGTCFAMSPTIRTYEEIQSMSQKDFIWLYETCVKPGHKEGDERLTPFFYEHDLLTMASKLPENFNGVRIFIDCGYDDQFIEGVCLFNDALEKKRVPHVLRLRAGAHTWDFWQTSLKSAYKFWLD